MPSPAHLPFHQAWTLSDSEDFLANNARSPDRSADIQAFETWRIQEFAPRADKLEAAVLGHLRHLSQTQGLTLPLHGEHVSLPWLADWRRLATNPDAENLSSLGELLMGAVHMEFLAYQDRMTPQQVHEKVLSLVGNGHFRHSQLSASECRNSGHRLAVQFNAWGPTVGTYDYELRQVIPLAPGQVQAPAVHHATIEVPSGELWVHDWFRVPAFTTRMDRLETPENDIGSLDGTIRQAKAYAKLNVASVVTGRRSGVVHQHQGGLQIGIPKASEDNLLPAPPGHEVAQLHNDLRWITVIDKQVLLELIAESSSMAEAQKQLAAWVKEEGGPTARVQVQPGTYHIYFAGRPSVMAATAHFEELDLSAWEEPFMLVHPARLTPKPGMADPHQVVENAPSRTPKM